MKNLATLMVLFFFLVTVTLNAQTDQYESVAFKTTGQSIFNAAPGVNFGFTHYLLDDNGVDASFFVETIDLDLMTDDPATKTGIQILFKFGLDFDLYTRFGMNSGTADINYPVKIKFSKPEDHNYGCNEEVTIQTSYEVEDNYKLTIHDPKAEFAVGTQFSEGFFGGAQACLLGACSEDGMNVGTGYSNGLYTGFRDANAGNFKNYLKKGDHDFFRISTDGGIQYPWNLSNVIPPPGFLPPTSLPLRTSDYPDLESYTNLQGTFDYPIKNLDGTDNRTGNVLTDKGEHEFLDLEFDPIHFQEYLTRVPLSYSLNVGFFHFNFNIISIPLLMNTKTKHEFKFDPKIKMNLDLGRVLGWKEMNGTALVQSGYSQLVQNFTIGNDLNITMPLNGGVEIKPFVKLENEFTTKLDLELNSGIAFRMMEGSVKIDNLVDKNAAPWYDSSFALVNETFPFPPSTTNIVNKTFQMGGFNTKTLNSINLVPDVTPPVMTTHDITVYIPDAGGNVKINPQDVVLSASDANGGTIHYLSVTPSSFDCSKLGQNLVVVVIDDGRCNQTTATAIVTVIDRTPPTAICKNFNAYLNNQGQATVTIADVFQSGSDNCGTVTPLYLSRTSYDCSDIGDRPNFLTVTDGHGNNNACLSIITVIDNMAPTVACQPTTVYLNAAGSATVNPASIFLSGSDNCGTVNLQAATPGTFICNNIGDNLVFLTVNDGHGNTAVCNTTVTVLDKIAPSVVCKPATVNLDNNGAASIITANVFQSGADNCGVVNQESVMPSTFNCSTLGVNTVVLTVNDSHGNTNTCSAAITVRDLIKPVVNCPANITRDNDPGICGASVAFHATATDNCSVSSLVSVPESASLFNVGSTSVKYTATDISGNSSTCTFTVTVKDVESPVITCPANVNLENELGKCSATATYNPATATDNCAVQCVMHIDGRASGLLFPVGVSYVSYRATDIYGNSSTCSFSVEIRDTEAPKMVCPMNLNKPNAFGDCGRRMYIIGNPTQLSDNCGVYGVTNDSPVDFSIGETLVTWTIQDIHNNTATCVQSVTIFDQDWPTVTCPQNMKIKTDEGYCEASNVTFNAIAKDNCPGVVLEYDHELNYLFPVGYTNVEATATDVYGHESKCVFQVIVETRPEICNGVDDDCDGIADEIQDWREIFRAEAANGKANDQLGSSVAIDGDWALMGTPGAGLAYLLHRNENDPTDWDLVKEFNNGIYNTDDLFGSSVSLQNGIAVVGAPNNDTKANNAGSVHIFAQNPNNATEWSAVKTIYATDAAEAANFGKSLKVKGQTLMVGATGANAAYIFNQNEGGSNNWGQSQKLVPSDATIGSEFGLSLDFDQQTAVVGSPNEGAGAVYAFDPANGWIETQKIQPTHGDAGDRFAQSINLEGKRLVIGTPGDDDKGLNAGAAYVFGKNQNGAFVQVNKIIDVALGTAGDEFGYSVSTRGDYLAVGAPSDDLRGKDAGAVHIFLREDGGWLPLIALTQQGSRNLDHFGYSLQLQPGTLIAGTPGADIGTQLDRGSVAIFEGLCSPSNIGQRESDQSVAAATADLILAPNPTIGEINVQFALSADQAFSIRVLGMSGKLVMSREGQGQKGENTFPLNLTGFAAGVYVVDFQSEGLKGQKRLVVQQN
ncbi:MAG: HYR domain-containing protein [Phycisphaerae bacterium]|nr:HYR domain-containing protein [Saprospiraceae bacterium]